MFANQDSSIAVKLTKMNLFVTGGALLLAGVAVIAYASMAYRRTVIQNLSTEAQIIGFNSISPLLFNDPAAADRTLSALQASPNTVFAGVYTPDRQLFAAYWRHGRGAPVPLPAIPRGETERFISANGEIWLVRSILFQGKPAGIVFLRSDLSELNQRLRIFAGIVGGILVVSLLTALFLAARLRRAIAQPIEERQELADRGLAARTAELEAQTKVLREQAALLDLAHDCVFVRDMNNTIRFWNRGAEETYGWTKEEALGNVPYTLLQTRFPAPLEKINEQLFRTGHWEGELIHTCRNGSQLVMDSRWALLRAEDGSPSRILELNRDITERKRSDDEIRKLNQTLEQKVAQRTAALEESNKELEAFTYSVSHDLRAPLRHVDGFSRMLLDEHGEKLDPEAKRLLNRVRQATLHMGALVDDLLNLSRISRREPNPLVTDLGSIVDDVLAELKPSCQGREVEFQVGPLPFAQCDPGLMRQVFANLLSNALKFTRPRKPAVIEVGQTARNGHDVVFVRDNGVGFSMKYADKLFGVFQRLHRPEDFEGTGVGLATVQRIIQKHGGQIWVEAEIDKGATFFFTLDGLDGEQALAPAVAHGSRSTDR